MATDICKHLLYAQHIPARDSEPGAWGRQKVAAWSTEKRTAGTPEGAGLQRAGGQEGVKEELEFQGRMDFLVSTTEVLSL